MKKSFKKILALGISLVLMLSVFVFSASADVGTVIRFSNNSPKVNTEVTITVAVNSSEPMYAVEFTFKYDSSILQFISGDSANGGAGSIKVASAISGEKSKSFNLKFKTIKAGTATVAVDKSVSFASLQKDDIAIGAAVNMTVSDITKSTNANLKSLSLDKGTLSPKFSKNTTTYTATVANSVESVRTYATVEDSKAKVTVSASPKKLIVGKNTVEVTVTAESGAVKKYTIVITRLEKTNEPDTPDTPVTPELPENTPANPYEVMVDDVKYIVSADISGTILPNGFTAAKAEYNGVEVAVAEDADRNFTIYYLKALDGSDYAPYILKNEEFKKLNLITFGANTYLISDLPENHRISDDYYSTTVEIGGINYKCYAEIDPNMTDFYYFYCFFEDEFSGYRYDSKEGVLQRCPEFELVKTNSETIEDITVIDKFSTLSNNGKTIVVGIIAAILAAIALVVLLVVKFLKERNYPVVEVDFDFGDEFDEVNVTQAYEDLQLNEEESLEEIPTEETNPTDEEEDF